MRLLLLSMDYPPRMAGGTTIHTRALATALVAEGHEATVVAAAHPDAPAEEVMDGVRVRRVRRPYTLTSAPAARGLLDEVDVVHGHGTCAYGHLLTSDFPTVVKMHSTWREERRRYRELGRETAAMRLYEAMDRACARRARRLICITERIARETAEYGVPWERMTVINNGVDVDAFRGAAPVEVPDARGPVVGVVGRLEPHKGVDTLLRALEGLEATVWVVGDGSQRQELERQARLLGVDARFQGFVDHAELPRHYAAMDLVGFPTRYEPLGNVVLEAKAAGKPLVASRTGGIPEVFTEGAGVLVPPGDEVEWRKVLSRLLEDPALRADMAKRAREAAQAHSWREVARRTVAVCEDALTAPPPR